MNRVLAHTGARYPIVQAPMGWIARSPLASAVSRAGGLGVIETSSGETDNCQREIRAMVDSGLPFGVNLPIRFLKDEAMLRFLCEVGIRFVTTSAGSPAKFIAPLKAAGIVVYHAVPTVEMALKCVEAGVDGLVVEGGEGGGFKNPEEVSTLVLLQAIREKVGVPLIAAGGINCHADIARLQALGVQAVQLGTAFAVTEECDAHPNFKQVLARAKPSDMVEFISTAGLPARAVRTPWLARYILLEDKLKTVAHKKKKCNMSFDCLAHCGLRDGTAAMGQFCIDKQLGHALSGEVDKGLFFRGAAALPFGEEIRPVQDLMAYLLGNGAVAPA